MAVCVMSRECQCDGKRKCDFRAAIVAVVVLLYEYINGECPSQV